jgi:NAD(P)H-flavin reductase
MIESVAATTMKHIDPMFPERMLIKKLTWETDDTFTLLLEQWESERKEFNFLPGQFNMLYAFGVGEAAISISSDPHKPKNLIHTIDKKGIVTSALSRMKRGDIIGVRGPFGSSWPVEKAKGMDVCLVAGGIGLAPLRPVLYHLFRNRKDYGKIAILYGARTPLNLLYRVELEQWSKNFNVDVAVTVDRSDTSWKGHVGVVTNLFSYINLDAHATLAMICGPETMMHYTLLELVKRGIPQKQIYLSMERNMKCAVGFCGHCQFGPKFICKDGPVFALPQVKFLLDKKEI